MINEIAGRRIIITGGAGFIGHHMALTLKKRGAEVEVIDSLQVNNLSAFAGNADNISNRSLYLHLIHERLDLLHYLRCRNSLIVERDHVRRFCDERRLEFIGIDSIGAAWRTRWDSLVLFTPRRYSALAGLHRFAAGSAEQN